MRSISVLGILFSPKLKFDRYINNIINIRHIVLEFLLTRLAVILWFNIFQNVYIVPNAFCPWIRFCNRVINLNWKQKNSYVVFCLNVPCPGNDTLRYTSLRSILNIKTLKQHRVRLDLILLVYAFFGKKYWLRR